MRNAIEFVAAHKRHLTTAALVLGFVVDIVTFRNLDLTVSEIILAVHLGIVAGATLFLAGGWMKQAHQFLEIAQQYSTGNLLSAFLVLYSASGSLAASWPFFVLVIAAAVGNETIRLEKNRLPFQAVLLFLALILFALFAVPLALGSLGASTFLIAMVIAWVVFSLYIRLGRALIRDAFRVRWLVLRSASAAIFGLMLFLYFTNLIPPIPLSVKDAGFYHMVSRIGDGYVARDEERAWHERFFDFNGVVLRLVSGEQAYFYSAIFAPARLDTEVVHRWEKFDPVHGWVTRNTVAFPITGGRHGGYRGYSLTDSPAPGRWRVSVETVRGQVIGRTYLIVERAQRPPSTSEKVL